MVTRLPKQRGKFPKCKKCQNVIKKNQLHVVVEGLYAPLSQSFAVKCKFRFCPDATCLEQVPARSNIKICTIITIDNNIELSEEERLICEETGKLSVE